eukprot:5321956-Prymnesium_polylepis.2
MHRDARARTLGAAMSVELAKPDILLLRMPSRFAVFRRSSYWAAKCSSRPSEATVRTADRVSEAMPPAAE